MPLQVMQGNLQETRRIMSSTFFTSGLNIRQPFELQDAHRGGQGMHDPFCKNSPLLHPVHIVMLAILQLRQPWGTWQGRHLLVVKSRAWMGEHSRQVPLMPKEVQPGTGTHCVGLVGSRR